MSYGHPIPCGHGRRNPAYRWSPTVLPPSRRRARHAGYTRHYSYVPRFRFSTPGRRTSACRASRDRPQRALPTREPSLGRLLGKGVVFLAGGILKFLADEALAGRRVTKSFESFLGFCTVLAVMSSSAIGLVLGGLYLFVAYMDGFAGGAAAASMEEYDEAKKRMCINRKTSVEAPPTPDELRGAWKAARGRGSLAAKLLTGTLLSNLEPSVDQSYLRAEDGTIVGRRPGLKGWLRGYCPDLVPHYKALMSYKALADKLRVALGIEEPDTLSGVIDFGGIEQKRDEEPSGSESSFGEAEPDRGLKKDEGATMGVGAPKDAGGAAKDGGKNPKSLKFRTSFRLQMTNGKTVVEGIHLLFGELDSAEPNPKTATARKPGATGGELGTRNTEEMGEEIAKTSVFSAETDATESRADEGFRADEGSRSDESFQAIEGPRAGQGALGETGPATMAALEAAVRERLGLCWMRRAGRRPRTA